jgi:hypothetical protein
MPWVFKILNHPIAGKATDSTGRRFSISGTIKNGKISGGFALTNHLAVKFTGYLDKSGRAQGTWKDKYQCQGEWKAKRVLKRTAKKH